MGMAGITDTITVTAMTAITGAIVIPDITVIIRTVVTGIGIMIAIATIPAIISAKQMF
jgi:hypothetical protein